MRSNFSWKEKLIDTDFCKAKILNEAFKKWEGNIVKNLKTLESENDDRYLLSPRKELFKICEEHAKSYKKVKQSKKSIILTHPFFLHLSHLRRISNENVKKEAEDYLNSLDYLLSLKRDRDHVGIIVLETLYHYAAATNELLERGLIDQVIFTEYDSGEVISYEELKQFKGDTLFFGGGYNYHCLTSSIKQIGKYVPMEKIWVIRDLVLNSPCYHHNTLKVNEAWGVNPKRNISLKKTLEKLSIA